jgi:hypothetical protein
MPIFYTCSDQAPDYSSSCGKCKEVRCKPMRFADLYGQVLDRKDGVCYNLYASVVVMITDTCPCHWHGVVPQQPLQQQALVLQ